MELFQVFWSDQNKLFLEFKKNEKEKEIYLPDQIKRLNLQFEISKQEVLYKEPPYLISIKKLYHSDESLAFTIDLDLINNFNDLQIKILQLYIFLNSGQKIEYSFREIINVSEIEFNEDYYLGFEFEELTSRKNLRSRFSQEKTYEKIKTDFNKNEQKRTVIFEKKTIDNIPENNTIISMVSESNKTLKNIEEQLKNLAVILKNVSFNNTHYIPPIPAIKRSQDSAIEIRRRPPSRSNLIQEGSTPAKILVIKEMKSLFQNSIEKNDEFNIHDILKPMSEEEFNAITLSEEVLKEREHKAISNQIKRLENKKKKKISLENLKKPE
ncbi:MAG: hypothetical protein ACFE91_04880 [Promethearchaeota archaeon]